MGNNEGNALGPRRELTTKPCKGATNPFIPGRLLVGCELRTSKTVYGARRPLCRIVPPLQGFCLIQIRFPGCCPWAALFRPRWGIGCLVRTLVPHEPNKIDRKVVGPEQPRYHGRRSWRSDVSGSLPSPGTPQCHSPWPPLLPSPYPAAIRVSGRMRSSTASLSRNSGTEIDRTTKCATGSSRIAHAMRVASGGAI